MDALGSRYTEPRVHVMFNCSKLLSVDSITNICYVFKFALTFTMQ